MRRAVSVLSMNRPMKLKASTRMLAQGLQDGIAVSSMHRDPTGRSGDRRTGRSRGTNPLLMCV